MFLLEFCNQLTNRVALCLLLRLTCALKDGLRLHPKAFMKCPIPCLARSLVLIDVFIIQFI